MREGDYSREVIILNNAHWKSCPKYIVFYYPLIKKMITSNKLNMHGLFKCFKFGSSINFQSVNILSDRA